MATPQLTKHSLDGGLGPILVDVRAPAGSSPCPAVVIVHGYQAHKDYAMLPALADRLARAGFTAVALNLSGSGMDDRGELVWPDRFRRNTFATEIADTLTVVNSLRQGRFSPEPTSIGVIGHSRGGGSSILAAAAEPAIGALVTWASISSVGDAEPGIEIGHAAARLTIPWLIVHGTADETVPFAAAEELKALNPRDGTRLLAIEGAGHEFGAGHPYTGPTRDLERVFDATVSWFSRHLP